MVGANTTHLAHVIAENAEDDAGWPLLPRIPVCSPIPSVDFSREEKYLRRSNALTRSVAFISFVRVIFLDKLHRNADPDFTWAGARFGMLCMIEVNAAIVVACLITLKPLSHKLWPNLLRDHSLEQLDGDNPPTIGSGPPPLNGNRRRNTTGKDTETWEMSNTGSETDCNVFAATAASSSHEARV